MVTAESSPRVASEKKQEQTQDNTNTFPNTAVSKFHTITLQTYRMLIISHAYGPGFQSSRRLKKRLLEAAKGGQNSNYLHSLVLGDMKSNTLTQVISRFIDVVSGVKMSWDYHISTFKPVATIYFTARFTAVTIPGRPSLNSA